MNRLFLLDSLDGMKSLVFGLLSPAIRERIASVPMTTDGLWNDAEMRIYEKITLISQARTHWQVGAYINVPLRTQQEARNSWLSALEAIEEPYLWLDPDTGFLDRHNRTRDSDKIILISELERLARTKHVLIVYRHQYRPERDAAIPEHIYSYVWHGLNLIAKKPNLQAFAYQSLSASLFFVSASRNPLNKMWDCLRSSMEGVSEEVLNRRMVTLL